MIKFTLKNKSRKARTGILELKHGIVETPTFMTVGTYGSVSYTHLTLPTTPYV